MPSIIIYYAKDGWFLVKIRCIFILRISMQRKLSKLCMVVTCSLFRKQLLPISHFRMNDIISLQRSIPITHIYDRLLVFRTAYTGYIQVKM